MIDGAPAGLRSAARTDRSARVARTALMARTVSTARPARTRFVPTALVALAVFSPALLFPPAALSQTASGSRLLSELNWMEVREIVPARTETVLLAVGTLEAHGVTANGADIIVPDSLAGRLAEEMDALVAPTLNYGVNTSLDEYPGTFGISADLLRENAEAVMRGLAGAGFRNIIVLNGHGPNFGPLNEAARIVFRATDARIATPGPSRRRRSRAAGRRGRSLRRSGCTPLARAIPTSTRTRLLATSTESSNVSLSSAATSSPNGTPRGSDTVANGSPEPAPPVRR